MHAFTYVLTKGGTSWYADEATYHKITNLFRNAPNLDEWITLDSPCGESNPVIVRSSCIVAYYLSTPEDRELNIQFEKDLKEEKENLEHEW